MPGAGATGWPGANYPPGRRGSLRLVEVGREGYGWGRRSWMPRMDRSRGRVCPPVLYGRGMLAPRDGVGTIQDSHYTTPSRVSQPSRMTMLARSVLRTSPQHLDAPTHLGMSLRA